MTTLVLLRHGQTDWNLKHRYQGLTDIPLNATGEEQARAAKEKLKPFVFDAVYCSDLERARRTAELALDGLFPYQNIHFDRRIRERSFGIYEGGPYDKVDMPPHFVEQMKKDPEGFRFPEGESLLDLEKRVRPFYEELIKNHEGQTVLIVAHGSLLAITMFVAENKPVNDKTRCHLRNAEPYILQV